jgi:hypothetical protein
VAFLEQQLTRHVPHDLLGDLAELLWRDLGLSRAAVPMAATVLFDLDRRLPDDGKPAVLYVRDKRHPGAAPPH